MNLPTLAVLVFGGILCLFWRSGELRFVQVGCACLVGFFLADSRMAPEITHTVQALFTWVGTWRF